MPDKLFIKKVQLKNYRNFSSFEIQVKDKPVILTGENGAGKTNILESISLLSVGKGLARAKFEEICRSGTDNWHSCFLLQSKMGLAEIRSSFTLSDNKRLIEFNGARISSNELNRFVKVIWLTPQMEGIFLSGISERRKFFDRIVYTIDTAHAIRINKYEYYLQERAKILQQDYQDFSWLKVLEEKIAEISIEITKNRLQVLEQLQRNIIELESEFPKAILRLEGEIETQILACPEAVANFIKEKLYQSRLPDKMLKKTTFGIHRSDFMVFHQGNNKLAKFCSTGEQKALLIAILLAQITSSIKDNNVMPICLLDEVFVHLDNRRKDYLTDFFTSLNVHIWLTATDVAGIEKLASQIEVVKL